MLASVLFREYEKDIGNHMLDCPAQYQTSPNVTWSMAASVVLLQPDAQWAVIFASPPEGVGFKYACAQSGRRVSRGREEEHAVRQT